MTSRTIRDSSRRTCCRLEKWAETICGRIDGIAARDIYAALNISTMRAFQNRKLFSTCYSQSVRAYAYTFVRTPKTANIVCGNSAQDKAARHVLVSPGHA